MDSGICSWYNTQTADLPRGALRIEEVFYEDERVVSMVSRLNCNEDCRTAPEMPRVCIVECPNGCARAVASSNLSATQARLSR